LAAQPITPVPAAAEVLERVVVVRQETAALQAKIVVQVTQASTTVQAAAVLAPLRAELVRRAQYLSE
jgi:peptidyl-tRNA hydrolase